jgi:hypothetical protein
MENAALTRMTKCQSLVQVIHEGADIPSGIVALCKIIVSNPDNFFGHQNLGSHELGEQLEFGTFGITYKQETDSSQVVKVAIYGFKDELEKEASILSKLQRVEGVLEFKVLLVAKR